VRGAWLVGLLRCIDYKRLIVAGSFIALPTRCVPDKCAEFGKRAVWRIRYLRACPAVTRFAILSAGRPLGKNHGCCPDAAGFNAPKSWAGVFHGGLRSASEQTPRTKPFPGSSPIRLRRTKWENIRRSLSSSSYVKHPVCRKVVLRFLRVAHGA